MASVSVVNQDMSIPMSVRLRLVFSRLQLSDIGALCFQKLLRNSSHFIFYFFLIYGWLWEEEKKQKKHKQTNKKPLQFI